MAPVALVALCASFGLAPRRAAGADWPTYRHDPARSGVTSEPVTPPLALRWVFQPRHAPQPAWPLPKPVPVEGILEMPRNRFDNAFHVAVAGSRVYFGSSADNKVTALDAATGKVLWSVFTSGPVRTAPTVWRDRVFAASDDGWVYCLRAADGSAVWKLRGAAGEQRLLGNGKMVSLWPVRTGVLVDGDVAYFAAGIFPSEGICLYAVRASDGKVLWKNDWAADGLAHGSRAGGNLSPQGYPLASSTMLFVPNNRVSPAAFDRATGEFRSFPFFGKRVGGTYALVADDHVYTGTSQLVAHTAQGGRFAYFSGRKLIVAPDAYYLLSGRDASAIDRTTYPALARRRQSLLGQRTGLDRTIRTPLRTLRARQAAARTQQRKLDDLKRKLDAAAKAVKPDAKALAVLTAQVAAQVKVTDAATRAVEAAEKPIAPQMAKRTKLTEDLKKTAAGLKAAVKWTQPCECDESFILAAGVLFAGGSGEVLAFDAATGKKLWAGEVAGTARGLAAARGCLFASSDTGAIYCFGKPGGPKPEPIEQPVADPPFPKDKLTPLFESAAKAIVERTGVRRGYCLVLGSPTGRLACELARRTDLMIYAVEPDPANVAAARKALDAAGFYGTRVCVDQAPLGRVPYSDYFADLIVSETALVSGKLPPDPKEAYRMLKPLGGTLCISQPPARAGEGTLLRWLEAMGAEGKDAASALRRRGTGQPVADAIVVRGPLKGAGKWTHQYAEPGNTACSDDQLVKCPLGLLWFGEPGPAKMINRHESAPAPLSLDGRMFIQGENLVMAYDIYNGLKLWERPIPGARRTRTKGEGGNLALNGGSLFVAVRDKCLRLDVATGETQATYAVPPAPDGKPRLWGYVATVGDLLFGSRTRRGRTSNCLFAIDLKTGGFRWVHNGGSISHITIAIGDGRVFFVDSSVLKDQREEALREKTAALKTLTGRRLAEAKRRLAQADVRRVIALDAPTGIPVWQRPIELTDCRRVSIGGGELIAMYSNGLLVFCAASYNGHHWRQFMAGDFARRGILVLSGKDGSAVWQRPIGHRIRPLIVDDMLVAEPWAYDLKTGVQKMRTHPVTWEKAPWQFARPGHHCGAVSGCSNVLFFRSWTIAYYDLLGDCGTQYFGGQRPGCWINTIPAGGLVLVPEASSGCMCNFPNMCSVVFQHRKENKAWAMYSVPGKATPAVRIAINLGAPGDRKDAGGTLWLGYPRPGGALVTQYSLKTQGGSYFRRNARALGLKDTDKPWVYASACRGLRSCSLPLVGKKEPPGIYTVRLHFIDLANEKPGERVFDVKVQGKVVLPGFDIAQAAGGGRKPVVKEFRGIEVRDKLLVELVAKDPKAKDSQAPVLSGIEAVRTQVRAASFEPPTFELCDLKLADERAIVVINHSDKPFTGKLHLGTHDKVKLAPATIDLALPPKTERAFPLTATCAKGVAEGDYAVPIRLADAQGTVIGQGPALVSHSGKLGRIIIPVAEDCAVRKSGPTRNLGSDERWAVDGGGREMLDSAHTIVYLRFPLGKVPGPLVSAELRLHVGPWSASESGDSGRICLVEGPWQEKTLTYAAQPKIGAEVGRIGRVQRGSTIVRPLKLSLEGRKELSLALVPTSTDGAMYHAREGGKPAELIIRYGP